MVAVARRAGRIAALPIALACASGSAGGRAAQRYTAPDGVAGRIAMSTSCRPAAQDPFEQGAGLLQAFAFTAARAAFERAADADPDCAMAYWGQAMTWAPFATEGIDDADRPSESAPRLFARRQGRAAVARAAAVAAPTAREREFVAASARLFESETAPDAAALHAYNDAISSLAAREPQDPNAAALLAFGVLAERAAGGSPTQDAAVLLSRARTTDPDHAGLLHALIHAYDSAERAGSAAALAARYEQLAVPAVHARLCPSRIYLRLGRWEDAVRAGDAAWALDREDLKGEPPDHGALLAREVQVYARLQQGRYREAEQLIDEAARLTTDPSHATRGPSSDSTPVSYAMARMRARVMLERADTGAQMELTADAPSLMWFARGVSAARALTNGGKAGPVGAANEALARLEQGAAAAGSRSMEEAERLTVQAAIAAASEERLEMELLLSRALELESAKPLSALPPTILPLHEIAGELWLKVYRYADARRAFESSLAKWPGRARSLLGLGVASSRDGDETASRQAFEALAANWTTADPDLRELETLRSHLSRPR